MHMAFLPLKTTSRYLPHGHLLWIAHTQRYDSAVTKPEEWKVELDGCDLDTIKSPFMSSEYESFEILIASKGRLTCLSFVTDEGYLLPIL